MNLYISIDMEGITGIVDSTFVQAGKLNYERGRQIMTDEANHIIEAAFEAGFHNVTVNDSHSKMNNLLIEQLHPDAQLIMGDVKPFSMVQGLDASYDAAVFAGYHARSGKPGVLSHTMIFGARNMYINDLPVGELGFNAYIAGYYQVPIIMVAGDDGAASEAEALIPGVTTAVVKQQVSRTAAVCLTPQKAGELLRVKMQEAVEKLAQVKPLCPPSNPILRIEFTNYGEAEWASLMPGTVLEEGTTVRYAAKDILEAYKAMLVMTELASRAEFC
jgi:D-amino peptidase